jgi:restriction endonuclease Mrr
MLPKFKEYFYPFLSSLKDGEIHSLKEIKTTISNILNLTTDDLNEKTKGGRSKHEDRVKWAVTYLKGVNLIYSPSIGNYQITQNGIEAITKYGDSFSLNTVRDMQGYKELSRTSNPSNSHWVEGHYRYDGTYVAGYYSNFKSRGIRKTKASRDK